jgi:hypothetical protein
MRRAIVVVLVLTESLVACAIFACSLELSHAIGRSRPLGVAAASVVRSAHSVLATSRRLAASTRRIAIDGVRVHISIGDA